MRSAVVSLILMRLAQKAKCKTCVLNRLLFSTICFSHLKCQQLVSFCDSTCNRAHWINLGPLIDYLVTRAHEELGTFLIGTSGNRSGCGNPTSKTFTLDAVDAWIRSGVDYQVDIPHWSVPDFDEKGRWLSAPMLDTDELTFCRPGKHMKKANVIATVFNAMGSNGRSKLNSDQLKSFFGTLEANEASDYMGEKKKWDSMFDSIDADGSGDISFNELYYFLYEMGTFTVGTKWGYSKEELRAYMIDRGMKQVQDLSSEQYDELFNKIDADGSGDISFYEFWDFFGNKDKHEVKNFSKSEMYTYMIEQGMDNVKMLSAKQYGNLFGQIDLDGSGYIDFYEFWVRMIQSSIKSSMLPFSLTHSILFLS